MTPQHSQRIDAAGQRLGAAVLRARGTRWSRTSWGSGAHGSFLMLSIVLARVGFLVLLSAACWGSFLADLLAQGIDLLLGARVESLFFRLIQLLERAIE